MTSVLQANDFPPISVAVQDEHFIIIDKPAGLPSAPLKPTGNTLCCEKSIVPPHSAKTHSAKTPTMPTVCAIKSEPAADAFSQAAVLFSEITNVCGKKSIEGGLVHRLDTATRGLLLIARTQNAYDAFVRMQKEGGFIKYYCAYCNFQNANTLKSFVPPITVESRFRSFGAGSRAVKPVFENASKAELKKAGTKIYRTEILCVKNAAQNTDAAHQSGCGGNVVSVLCRIREGFRHQVRAHLASYGLPVIGDVLYNPFCVQHSAKNTDMRFYACAFEFNHPVSGQPVFFCLKEFKDIVCASCAKAVTPICI